MSFSESDVADAEDTLKLDFADPAFILRNINYQRNFEEFDIINEECRTRMIKTSCDQACFFVLCALKAYEVIGEVPTILVYGGGGVMGNCLIDALEEVGCKPLLKVFSRDPAMVQKWLSHGIRTTVKIEDDSKIDILLVASNIMGFSQLCRDVGPSLRSTTFVISTVFSLQRKRIFHLFEAPGVMRTFVERKMSKRKKFSSAKLLLYRKDSMRSMFLIVENYMVLLGIEPGLARDICFDIFLGRNNVHQPTTPRNSFLLAVTPGPSPPSPSSSLSPPPPLTVDFFSSSDSGAPSPASFMSDNLSPVPSPSSCDIFTPIKAVVSRRPSEEVQFSPRTPSSLPSISPSCLPSKANSTSDKLDKLTHQLALLSAAIQCLESAYGVSFAEELSKHIEEVTLPTLNAIRCSSTLHPVVRGLKPKYVDRRRSFNYGPKHARPKKIYRGYLDTKSLLRIFNSDKKTAPDIETSDYLEHINSDSDSDDDAFDSLDIVIENARSAGGDIFDDSVGKVETAERLQDSYVVKGSAKKKGAPMISRMESDIFVGKAEGKRFNMPSVIKVILEEHEKI